MSNTGIEEKIDRLRLLEDEVIALKRELIQMTSLASIHQKDKKKFSFVILRIRDRIVAVPISFVVETVQMVELIPSAETVRGVAGLVNFHEEILAAIDVGVLLGLPDIELATDKAIAICRLGRFQFALLIDDVVDVLTVDLQAVKVEEEVLPGALKAIGVVKAGDKTFIIIDLWSVVVSVHTQMSQMDGSNILERNTADD